VSSGNSLFIAATDFTAKLAKLFGLRSSFGRNLVLIDTNRFWKGDRDFEFGFFFGWVGSLPVELVHSRAKVLQNL
jgi:hypothetical protein